MQSVNMHHCSLLWEQLEQKDLFYYYFKKVLENYENVWIFQVCFQDLDACKNT